MSRVRILFRMWSISLNNASGFWYPKLNNGCALFKSYFSLWGWENESAIVLTCFSLFQWYYCDYINLIFELFFKLGLCELFSQVIARASNPRLSNSRELAVTIKKTYPANMEKQFEVKDTFHS